MNKRISAVSATALLSVCVAAYGSPSTGPAVDSGPLTADAVAVYVTTSDLSKTLERQQDLRFQEGPGRGLGNVSIDATQKYQTLSAGFGIALTDSSAWLLREMLPPKLRNGAMAALFSPTKGIGLTYLRVGIGGTDYNVSRQPYTYDDLPPGQTDPNLTHFSMMHDQAYIIPAVQQALRLNPDIVMTASPWSPPAWMKTDGQLVPLTPLSFLKRDAFAPWAQYLVKFLQGYEAAGIHIDHMSIQNEPLNTVLAPAATLVGGFIPGMTLLPNDAITLINDHLAPAFRGNGITSKITIWDYAYDQGLAYIPLVMLLAGNNVGAIAYHCYVSDAGAMSITRALYNLPLYETECSSKLNNIEPAQAAIRALNNHAEGVQLWNAALDPQGGPKFGGGCKGLPTMKYAGVECTAPITVNPETRTYTLTSDYWALAHFSKFIKLGARRIDSRGLQVCLSGLVTLPCGLEGTAFENPDGARVLVVTTNNGQPSAFTLTENGRHVSYTLPAGATATFVWRP